MRAAWLVSFALALLLLAIPPARALACTPPPGGLPTFTIAEHVAAAPLVLEGTVASVVTTASPDGDVATVDVARWIKGGGSSSVTISQFGPSSLCRSQVGAGQHLIIYASRDNAGQLRAFYLSQFDAVAQATPANLAEALAAAGGFQQSLPLVLAPSGPAPALFWRR